MQPLVSDPKRIEAMRAAGLPAEAEDAEDADAPFTWGEILTQGRGTVGETVLHLCMLLHTSLHLRIIRILVPYLSTRSIADTGGVVVPALDASYQGEPYNGEVALHFAVIQKNMEMVRTDEPVPGAPLPLALCYAGPRDNSTST